jgi:hypothetical protein
MLVATGEVSFPSTLITSTSDFYSTEPRCFSRPSQLGVLLVKQLLKCDQASSLRYRSKQTGEDWVLRRAASVANLRAVGLKLLVSAPVFSGFKKR